MTETILSHLSLDVSLLKDINRFNSYHDIKAHFDNLNKDLSHFQNSNDICTPMELVKEMIDKIPEELWHREHLKILDPCSGNGNFHGYISTKTKLSNLYFNEINDKRIKNTIDYFGSDINLTKKDFLQFDDKEEYDLVVANPPYAKFKGDKRISKNHNLSRDFIRKALRVTKKGGYILFIVPDNWMSLSDRNTLPQEMSQYQFLYLNIHGAKKYFPKVGSSFTWFLLKKTQNTDSFIIDNNYVIKDRQTAKLPENITFIPLYYSDIVRSIIEKTLLDNNLPKYSIETSSYLHRTTKKEYFSSLNNKKYKHRIIHTPSQTLYSKVPHKYQNGYKVFISLTNKYLTFIDDCGMTQSIAFIRCKSIEEAKIIKKEMDSDVYVFLNNITRYGNFNNIRILQKFPRLGSFHLTENETFFIKSFNNHYYGKKQE